MGKRDNYLDPKNGGDRSNTLSRRRSLIRNPFSRSQSSNVNESGSATSPGPSFSISRALSGSRQDNDRQAPAPSEQSNARSPMLNPSPATRRPRAASPPPAYSQSVTSASGPTLGASPVYERLQTGAHPAISAAAASTAEDPYAFLSSFDTVFLIDDSGSMAGRSWRETQAAMTAIVPICTAHDEDGIDIYFMNHKSNEPVDALKGSAGTGFRGVRSLAQVEEIFSRVRPESQTPTGERLQNILGTYLNLYEEKRKQTGDETCLKPLNMIVVTDGCPSDDVEGWIIRAAKVLDKEDPRSAPPYQVGIQFFQVGNEPEAGEYLRDLDDELSRRVEGGIRDIVDTVSFDYNPNGIVPELTASGILKVVLGSVVKRLDRKVTARPAEAAAST